MYFMDSFTPATEKSSSCNGEFEKKALGARVAMISLKSNAQTEIPTTAFTALSRMKGNYPE